MVHASHHIIRPIGSGLNCKRDGRVCKWLAIEKPSGNFTNKETTLLGGHNADRAFE